MKSVISTIPAQAAANTRAEPSPRSTSVGNWVPFDEFTASQVDDGILEALILAMEIEMSRTEARLCK